MPRNMNDAKLRALIRKMVKEELSKSLQSQDPHSVSVPPDTFELDPRFSTGHYTVEHEPFPHSEYRRSGKRQSKRRTGKRMSDHYVDRFPHQPSGIFGPMPPIPEQQSPDRRRTDDLPAPRSMGPMGPRGAFPSPPPADFNAPPPYSEPQRSHRREEQ